jgi:hypothetical protein
MIVVQLTLSKFQKNKITSTIVLVFTVRDIHLKHILWSSQIVLHMLTQVSVQLHATFEILLCRCFFFLTFLKCTDLQLNNVLWTSKYLHEERYMIFKLCYPLNHPSCHIVQKYLSGKHRSLLNARTWHLDSEQFALFSHSDFRSESYRASHQPILTLHWFMLSDIVVGILPLHPLCFCW